METNSPLLANKNFFYVTGFFSGMLLTAAKFTIQREFEILSKHKAAQFVFPRKPTLLKNMSSIENCLVSSCAVFFLKILIEILICI